MMCRQRTLGLTEEDAGGGESGTGEGVCSVSVLRTMNTDTRAVRPSIDKFLSRPTRHHNNDSNSTATHLWRLALRARLEEAWLGGIDGGSPLGVVREQAGECLVMLLGHGCTRCFNDVSGVKRYVGMYWRVKEVGKVG